MHHHLASISLLATLAACGEPLLYEGEELDASAAAALTTSTLKLIEICDDGIDNDKDGYVDSADPDCKYSKTTGTIGFSGGIIEGTDIHPGWIVYFSLDGRKISVESRDGGLVVKDRYGTIAAVYTDSDAAWVGIGQRYDRYGNKLKYQDLIVLTEGGGAAYAPGQVGGIYDLEDPYSTKTDDGSTTPTTTTSDSPCTLSSC